jgi:(E)-4-hydroxy-3-methyl-but-2-enyl pyrophosphate reductase
VRVRLAKTAGFCMGVRLAMEKVLAEANRAEGPIYTFGPLIHNPQVMQLLESKGVKTAHTMDGITEGTVVIRAHGIPPDERRAIKAAGLRIIDATCPRVARVQSIVRSNSRKGRRAVIVGDQDHPEVIGLRGYAEGKAYLIERLEEVSGLPEDVPLAVVAQTTQDTGFYREVSRLIRERNPDARIFDTICDATQNRQAEVASFAGHVDAMVVVGGFKSGNTRRLVQVSEAAGLPSFHVETEKDLDREAFRSMDTVGVSAGASSPNWMIKNVVRELERIKSRKDMRVSQAARGLLRFLLFSHIWMALGAFSLTHAATLLAGREPGLVHPFMAALYIWAMHVLNRFLDRGASTYNEPDQAHFFKTHRPRLIITGVGAVAVSLMLAWTLGFAVLAAMAGVSALGVIYGVPVVPVRRKKAWHIAMIKEIPGSKTMAESLAWGFVIALVPLLTEGPSAPSGTIVSFFFVLSVVYVRSALFDIFEVQGDMIVGIETLPVTIGEERTLKLLKIVLWGCGLVLLAAGLMGSVPGIAFLLLLCVASFGLTIRIFQSQWLYPGLRLEAVVESNLLLAGLAALAWQMLS